MRPAGGAAQSSFIAFPCNLCHIVCLLVAQIKYDSLATEEHMALVSSSSRSGSGSCG